MTRPPGGEPAGSTSLPYFLATAADSMRHNHVRTILAAVAVSIPLYVLGVFAAVSVNLSPWVAALADEALLVVFLEDALAAGDRSAVEEGLQTPAVERATYVSPEEAARRLSASLHVSLEGEAVGSAPILPPSYEVHLTPEASAEPETVAAALARIPGVVDVTTQAELVRRLRLVLTVVRVLGAFLGTILTVAALITMSNVVRIIFDTRRDEVGILRLVGATDAFVKGPFLAEGALLGLAGGLLSVVALLVTRPLFASSLARAEGLLGDAASQLQIPFTLALLLLAFGAMLGLGSASLALRSLLGTGR